MSLIVEAVQGAAEVRATFQQAISTLKDPKQFMVDWFGGRPSASGVAVSQTTALWNTAVYAAVRVLAESVAQLPLVVYERRAGGGRARVESHPLSHLLHTQPNAEMTSFDMRETMEAWLVTWGNGFAEVVRNKKLEVMEIVPLRPDRTRAVRENGVLSYEYRKPDGQVIPLRGPSADPRKLPTRVFHLHGLGFDGVTGYTPVRMHANAIGLGMALEEYGARFFSNDARPGGILMHPGELSQPARDNLRDSFNTDHQGLDKSHKIAILEDGLKWETIGVKPEEAQFLQTRKYQTTEIARIYRIPPHLLQDLERSTNNNIEQQSLEFVIYTMMPWLVRWEQAIATQLFLPEERSRFFAEFTVDGLLRGQLETRYKAYATARQNGWMNGDEIRQRENMNPLPDGQGQVFLVPLNLVPLKQLTEGDGNGADSRAEQRLLERGALFLGRGSLRSAAGRRRIQRAHLGIFREAAGRLVKREARAVRKLIKAHLNQRQGIPDFTTGLELLYDTWPDTVEQLMAPAVNALGEAVSELAATEIGITVEEVDQEGLQSFLKAYVGTLGVRYASSSLGQLNALVSASASELLVEAALEDRLDEWDEKRPDKVAARETVQAGNAATRHLWLAAGTAGLVWTLTGSSNCPLCENMSGKRVKGAASFLDAGDTVDGSGDTAPLKVRGSVKHPPLHQGCDCTIVPAG